MLQVIVLNIFIKFPKQESVDRPKLLKTIKKSMRKQ